MLLAILAPILLKGASWQRIVAMVFLLLLLAILPRLAGQAYPFSPSGMLHNAAGFLAALGSGVRWLILALAALGAFVTMSSRRKDTLPTVMIAALLGCWAFHSIVNVPIGAYYVISAIPAVTVLAGWGASALLQSLSGTFGRKAVGGLLLVAMLGVLVVNVVSVQAKERTGTLDIAHNDAMFGDKRKIWLVGGDATFEGALIAEIDLRDSPGEHIVLRASKMLADSTWSGAGYRLRFPAEQGVSAFLDEAHIGWIVLRRGEPSPHMDELEGTLLHHPETWRRKAAVGPSDRIDIYERLTAFPEGPPKIEVDMTSRIGSILRLHE